MPEPASNILRAWSVLSWAAFLACSWTWCIGMWLPVILLRDFGIWSFAVFAIPNVVGAAAMGLALRKRGLSEWITTEHELAARAFSVVTVVFQLCFLFSLSGIAFATRFDSLGFIPAGVFGLAMIAIACVYRWIHQISLLVWVVSLLALFWSLAEIVPSIGEMPDSALDPDGLLWLAPVMVFGFMLCPYLDLTFHSTRRALPGTSGSIAFVIGFGMMFLMMIVGTLGYGLLVLVDHQSPLPEHLPLWIVGHIAMQLAFTVVAHVAGVATTRGDHQGLENVLVKRRVSGSKAMIPGFVLALGIIVVGASSLITYAGLTGTEIIYRGFMSFYGLIFPAYVWLCMLPLGTTRTARRMWTFVGAVVLAVPFYWMGFIERETWWLVPGVAIVLFAKFIAGGAPRRAA